MKLFTTKNILLTSAVLIAGAAATYAYLTRSPKDNPSLKSETVHTFKVEGLDGNPIDFSQFKGKKILIVNTASKCGLTPQYEGLERLHKKYGEKLVIIGFPANNFMFQEPGSNDEIAEFCQKNYGVSFLMASKIDVQGPSQAPIYQWLTKKSLNGVEDSSVKWNFQKYALDEEGKLVQHFAPNTDPEDISIIQWIES